MSDNYPIIHTEENNKFLKRKSLKKKKIPVQIIVKEFNLKQVKAKFIKELLEETTNGNNKATIYSIGNAENNLNEYESLQKVYNQNGLTHQLHTFINRSVIDNSTIPETIKTLSNLQQTFLKILKMTLMNEIEFLNMTIYLDRVKWNTEMDIEKYLLIVALAVKKNLNGEDIVYEYFMKNEPELLDKLNEFIDKNKKFNLSNLSQKEINRKYKEIGRSSSNYCKTNYLDYNFIVDKILKMSLPYSDAKTQKNEVTSQVKYVEQYPFYVHPPQYQMYPQYMPHMPPMPYPPYGYHPQLMNPMCSSIPPQTINGGKNTLYEQNNQTQPVENNPNMIMNQPYPNMMNYPQNIYSNPQNPQIFNQNNMNNNYINTTHKPIVTLNHQTNQTNPNPNPYFKPIEPSSNQDNQNLFNYIKNLHQTNTSNYINPYYQPQINTIKDDDSLANFPPKNDQDKIDFKVDTINMPGKDNSFLNQINSDMFNFFNSKNNSFNRQFSNDENNKDQK